MHPILIKTPYLTLYSYGLCVALATVLSLALAFKRCARAGLFWGDALDLLFILFVAGIAGARLFYVAQNWDYFQGDFLAMLQLQEGGLVWYGGFFFATLCGVLYCRQKKQSALRWADFFAPIAALAHAVGRVGCFLNGCCYGKNGHPVQLYESALLVLLAAVLFNLSRKDQKPGTIFASYLLYYGLLRFVLEFLRADQPLFLHLTVPQWTSAVLVAGAVLFLKRSPRPR